MEARSIYEFTMNDIEGKPVQFDVFKGRVLFIVNVASRCGFTPQYKGLQELYEKYREHGFLILGFPANNFLRQEPGSDSEIKEFCSLHYHVSFPLFSKISVKGEDISHLYTFLTEKETNPRFFGTIKWNFTKFLLDREGTVVDRFAPITKPNSKKVTKRIEQVLGLV